MWDQAKYARGFAAGKMILEQSGIANAWDAHNGLGDSMMASEYGIGFRTALNLAAEQVLGN